MINNGKDKSLVGQVFQFRLLDSEEDQKYYVMKSLNASKKSKNFVALLPKCLVSNFDGSLNMNISSEQTLKGLVLEIYRNSLPIVTLQPELISLKDSLLQEEDDSNFIAGRSYVGICNGAVGKAGQIGVRFLNGFSKNIKVKDLNKTVNYLSIYKPGKVLRVAVNKKDRLCTK